MRDDPRAVGGGDALRGLDRHEAGVQARPRRAPRTGRTRRGRRSRRTGGSRSSWRVIVAAAVAAPTSGRNAIVRYDPANGATDAHRTPAVASPPPATPRRRPRPRGVVPLDLAIPAQVFGTYEEAPYAFTVCAAAPVRCRRAPGFAIVAAGRPRGARERRHRDRPGLHAAPARARRAGPRRAARRPRARRADGLDLHGRVRPRRRRRARRPPRDHPLARRGRPRRASPARSPSNPTSSTSTRATCSPRRASPPAWTSACTSCAATTAPRSPTRSPAASSSRRTATAARPSTSSSPLPSHPGGSLAATRAWALERLARTAHRPRPRRPRPRLRAHLRPPLHRRDRRSRSCAGCSPSASTPPAPPSSPPTASIDDIADRCGFGTAANLRKHFHRPSRPPRPPTAAPSPPKRGQSPLTSSLRSDGARSDAVAPTERHAPPPARRATSPASTTCTLAAIASRTIYADDRDRREYLASLERVVERMEWLCLSYCLMGNHVHLLVETARRPTSGRGMHRLQGQYAQYFNRRHGYQRPPVPGPIRPRADHERRAPVDRRRRTSRATRSPPACAARPSDWPWSSHAAVVGRHRPRLARRQSDSRPISARRAGERSLDATSTSSEA